MSSRNILDGGTKAMDGYGGRFALNEERAVAGDHLVGTGLRDEGGRLLLVRSID